MRKSGQPVLPLTFLQEHQRTWPTDGTIDWLWPAAEQAGLPVGLLAHTFLPTLAGVAERHPRLRHHVHRRVAVAHRPRPGTGHGPRPVHLGRLGPAGVGLIGDRSSGSRKRPKGLCGVSRSSALTTSSGPRTPRIPIAAGRTPGRLPTRTSTCSARRSDAGSPATMRCACTGSPETTHGPCGLAARQSPRAWTQPAR